MSISTWMKDASAAEDASNKKPACESCYKKPLGLMPIGKAFEKSKIFARDDTRAKEISL